MKITRLSIISTIDKVFITTLLSLFSFVWIRYFIKNNIVAILISTILSTIVVGLSYLTHRGKIEKQITKLETEKRIDSFIYSLFLLGREKISKLFFEKISKKEYSILKNNIILLNDENIIPLLHKEEICLNDIASVYQKAKKLNLKKITILSISATPSAHKLTKSIKDIEIKIYEKHKTFYKYIQRYAIYPEILVAQKTSKKDSFLAIIKLGFRKERTKHFVLSGIIMLILSLFFKYNLYYTIVSSILFLFAIISFFVGAKNTETYN